MSGSCIPLHSRSKTRIYICFPSATKQIFITSNRYQLYLFVLLFTTDRFLVSGVKWEREATRQNACAVRSSASVRRKLINCPRGESPKAVIPDSLNLCDWLQVKFLHRQINDSHHRNAISTSAILTIVNSPLRFMNSSFRPADRQSKAYSNFRMAYLVIPLAQHQRERASRNRSNRHALYGRQWLRGIIGFSISKLMPDHYDRKVRAACSGPQTATNKYFCSTLLYN